MANAATEHVAWPWPIMLELASALANSAFKPATSICADQAHSPSPRHGGVTGLNRHDSLAVNQKCRSNAEVECALPMAPPVD